MFKNIIKIILRDLSKDKIYTIISILGLAAGICVSVLIIAINFTYLDYDNYHAKGERLYRAYIKNDFLEKGVDIGSNMPAILGETLKKDYPEVINTATLMFDFSPIFIVNNIKAEQAGCYSEASLFSMFSFSVLARSQNDKIFLDNSSIAISRSLAEKYFGGIEKAIGKRVTLTRTYEKEEVYVSTVYEDMSHNSTISYEYILPLSKLLEKQPWQKQWGNFNALGTYIELRPGIDINRFNNKIKHFITDNYEYNKSELFIYKYGKAFLNPPGGFNKLIIIKILFVIAGVILVIAAINFVNLATSRASKKGKEIGLRKVIGASRKSLVFRFMTETYILSFISLFIGLLMAELLVPYINYIFDTTLTVKIPYNNIVFDLSLAGLWFLMGLTSGLYPSLYLSGLTPGIVIKGNAGPGGKIFIRKSLITVQFVLSATFIFLSVVVYSQMKYITNKDLGLNVKQILEFPITKNIGEHFGAFTNELKAKPGIYNATCAMFEPVGVGMSTSDPSWEGKPANMNDMFPVLIAGDNFINTFGIKILRGRDFIEGDSADQNNFIINEEMEKLIKRSAASEVVGLGLSMWQMNGKIIGVVKNFHSGSLYQSIGPVIIWKNENRYNKCFIRFDAANLNNILPHIKKVYDKYETEYPLNYKFMDEEYLNQHSDAKTFVGFFSLFAAIAIIISCLGLFGLTAFNIQQRTKEVGIRKVLGASMGSLSILLTKSVVKMVLFSSVIALPAGYILAGKLLDMFAYKIKISPGIYLFTIGVMMLLACLTVIFQVIKAALANPVESLKYE